MDIATGDTEGRDELRERLGAPSTIPDAAVQAGWDAAVDATRAYIRPDFTTSAPQGVIEFVLAVAVHIWQGTRDSAGSLEVLPDGTAVSSVGITGNLVKRYLSLGGPYVRTPRTIGAGSP